MPPEAKHLTYQSKDGEVFSARTPEEAVANCPFLSTLPMQEAVMLVELEALGKEIMAENANPNPNQPKANKNVPVEINYEDIPISQTVKNGIETRQNQPPVSYFEDAIWQNSTVAGYMEIMAQEAEKSAQHDDSAKFSKELSDISIVDKPIIKDDEVIRPNSLTYVPEFRPKIVEVKASTKKFPKKPQIIQNLPLPILINETIKRSQPIEQPSNITQLEKVSLAPQPDELIESAEDLSSVSEAELVIYPVEEVGFVIPDVNIEIQDVETQQFHPSAETGESYSEERYEMVNLVVAAIVENLEIDEVEHEKTENFVMVLPETVQTKLEEFTLNADPEVLQPLQETIVEIAEIADQFHQAVMGAEFDSEEVELLEEKLITLFVELLSQLEMEIDEDTIYKLVQSIISDDYTAKTDKEESKLDMFHEILSEHLDTIKPAQAWANISHAMQREIARLMVLRSTASKIAA